MPRWVGAGNNLYQLHFTKGEIMSSDTEVSRADHLAWCKLRAMEYVDNGDNQQAFASMGSDLGKHPETAGHAGIELGMMQLMGGQLETPDAMRSFIEGFN